VIDLAFLPKAELHVHIEGTFEPELIFAIAERNGLKVKFAGVEALRDAYRFSDLQAFLNVYYAGMQVLQQAQDFSDLAGAYLRKAATQGVKHAEIFFDPQAHLERGVSFSTVMDGLWAVLSRSERDFGITTKLIMCFLRDQSAKSAMDVLELALPYGDRIVAVGLDSAEVGNPPSKFVRVFDRARVEGFLTVAHAGEEGPPSYVWEALDLLKVSRVDHGVRSMEDPRLIERLRRSQMPLTICPFSNVRLHVVPTLAEHPLKKMLNAGLRATVNSDDPAYFGGYVADNFRDVSAALSLSQDEIVRLAKNSFESSFIDDESKRAYSAQIDAAVGSAV